MEMSDRGKRWRSNAGSACGWSRCCPKPDSLIGTTSKESRSRIFLLGAAGEQEENGLGASASGPARTLTQNVPLGSRVVSQKVNFLGQGNKGGLTSSAVRRRTDEYPPARLLLPGGLEPLVLRARVRPGILARRSRWPWRSRAGAPGHTRRRIRPAPWNRPFS